MDAGKAAVISAVITASGAVVVALIGNLVGLLHFGPDPSLRYPVAVLDAVNKGAVPDAQVSLNLPELPVQQSDSAGRYTFMLSKAIIGKNTELTVNKDGYEGYREQIFSLQPQAEFHTIYLRPKSTVKSSTERPPTDGPPEVTRVYKSGQKLSGVGAAFSDWYTLCSEPEPGYHIKNASFALSGDRACNAWSECQPMTQTETQVCWKFRLQGHSERLIQGGQAYSEGILTVVWSKA